MTGDQDDGDEVDIYDTGERKKAAKCNGVSVEFRFMVQMT